jgi:hypothetical protein
MSGDPDTGVYEYGSMNAKLFSLLSTGKHTERVRLSKQELFDLHAWGDLSAPLFDRSTGDYAYGPDGSVIPPAEPLKGGLGLVKRRAERIVGDLTKGYPKESFARCASCHSAKDVLRSSWVNVFDPAQSLVLKAPLAEESGGTAACKTAPFETTADPDYQALLRFIRDAVRTAWTKPVSHLRPLVEAGQTPGWITLSESSSPP